MSSHLSILNIDPADPKTISAFVSKAWSIRHLYKYALERQWYLQIAWFKGNQNVIWDDVSRLLREPSAPPWRVRLVVNLLSGTIRTIISKYIRPRYEPDVLPPTEDALDIETAQLDKQVLQSYWKTERGQEKLLDAVEWMCQTGNAFIKVCWNPNAGDPLAVKSSDLMDDYYEKDDPVRASKLASAAKRFSDLTGGDDTLSTGNVEIEVIPPFEMMLDPFAIKGIEDSNWCMRSRIYDINIVKEEWGSPADKLVVNPGYYTTSAIFNYKERLQRLASMKGFIVGASEGNEPTVILHELYVKPRGRGKLKNGLYACVCQDFVLNGGGKAVEFPYDHGELPFIQLKEIHVKGSAWGTSTIEQLLHVQADYNRTKSQLVENRNMMGKPKWLVPENTIPDSYIDSEPGQVIKYVHGMKPEMVSPPPMPSYINDLLIGYRQDLEDISGQHEVSRAESPGEVRSGRGILALIEQDETRLGPGIERLDAAVAAMGKLILCTATQYVKEDRILRMVGDDDELILNQWTGKDLMGRNYGRPSKGYFDVRLSTVTGLPNSRSAQLSLIDSLANRGFLNPDRDRRLVFKLLGIGQVQGILDGGRIHRTRALVENRMLASGQQVLVEPYQDHESHLEIHNQYRNSAAYDQLDPQIKQIFAVHEQQHKEMAAMLKVEPTVLERKAIQQLIMVHQLMPPEQGQTGGQPPNKGNENGKVQQQQELNV